MTPTHEQLKAAIAAAQCAHSAPDVSFDAMIERALIAALAVPNEVLKSKVMASVANETNACQKRVYTALSAV